jgi:hypothetical protein
VTAENPQGNDLRAVIPPGYCWTGEVRQVRQYDLYVWWCGKDRPATVDQWQDHRRSEATYPIVRVRETGTDYSRYA